MDRMDQMDQMDEQKDQMELMEQMEQIKQMEPMEQIERMEHRVTARAKIHDFSSQGWARARNIQVGWASPGQPGLNS